MSIKILYNIDDVFQILKRHSECDYEEKFFVDPSSTIILGGLGENFNTSELIYHKDLSIPNEIQCYTLQDTNTYIVQFQQAKCGALILSSRDIVIGQFSNDRTNLEDQIFDALIQYLNDKNILTKRDNNDLLAYSNEIWFKIASFESIETKHKLKGIFISINPDLNLITKILSKNSVKVPGGLFSLFNITRDEILEIILPILEQIK